MTISGKFIVNSGRSDIQPLTANEAPFSGQLIQGFSGIQKIDGNRYYVLTDNGFGSKANSPDAMLFFHEVNVDFDSGDVQVEKTTFLSDPEKVIPFNLTIEGSNSRYLTGADFDIEGFQVINGKIFIRDEFGPYLFVADAQTGVVEEFHQTIVDGKLIQSPDHFQIRAGNPDDPQTSANLKRSRGYEGFAASMD